MRPVLKRARFLATLLGVTLVVPLGPANLSATLDPLKKLDPALTARARQSDGFSRVIVRTGTANSGRAVDALIRGAGTADCETIVGGTACTDPSCTQNIWRHR